MPIASTLSGTRPTAPTPSTWQHAPAAWVTRAELLDGLNRPDLRFAAPIETSMVSAVERGAVPGSIATLAVHRHVA